MAFEGTRQVCHSPPILIYHFINMGWETDSSGLKLHFPPKYVLSPQMCSSFAFAFVVGDFTLQSQLISVNKSQKAKDLHSSDYHHLTWCLFIEEEPSLTWLWLLNTHESPRVPWNSQTYIACLYRRVPSSLFPVEADESRVIAMGSIATTCQKYPSEPRLAYTQYVL